MADTDTKISLKLWIDKKRNRVVFAEAGKEFVDFLIEVFSLPIITVAGFLKTEDTAGGLQGLYESIENLSDTFIQQGVSKELVLKPRLVMSGATDSLLLPRVQSYTFIKLYKCRNSHCFSTSHIYKSTQSGSKYCYRCSQDSMTVEVSMIDEVTCANKVSGSINFVKASIPYMVLDDLKMKPMSANTFITQLNEYNLKDVGALQEKVVTLGMDEVYVNGKFLGLILICGHANLKNHERVAIYESNFFKFLSIYHLQAQCVKLLKAALQSKTVLTDVLLPRPSEAESSIKMSGSSDGPNEYSSVFLPD